MAAYSYLLGLLFIIISLSTAYSSILFSDFALPNSQYERCSQICNETYKASSNDKELLFESVTSDSSCCSRGCRFFNIAQMLTDMEANVALDACHGCCDDSYLDSKRKSCNFGCDTMSKLALEPVVIKSSFSLSIFFDDGETGVEERSQQSAGDIEMDDVLLTDPALRNQLAVNVISDDSKLPEMKVKTLPIDSKNKIIGDLTDGEEQTSLASASTSTSSTSDCLRWIRDLLQMDHVPPCVFAGIMILLIIVLLRYLFTCEIRLSTFVTHNGFNEDMDSLTKSAISSPSKTLPIAVLLDDKKDHLISSSNSFDSVVNIPNVHHNISPPPKYDEACNMISSSVQDDGNCDKNLSTALSSTSPINNQLV